MFGQRLSVCVLFVCAACNGQDAGTPPPSSPADAPAASVSAAPLPAAPAATASASVAPPAPTGPAFPQTPPELQVPPNSSLVLKARGKGVQIYECTAKADDKKAFEWKLKAPEAELFDEKGEKVGKHFAGPTWQATDGSSILGSVMGKADAPDGQAIPWLMLTTVGKGPGIFANVMHVQRLDTSGGKAPADGCDAAHAKSKAETRVPYEATYYFYQLVPGSK